MGTYNGVPIRGFDYIDWPGGSRVIPSKSTTDQLPNDEAFLMTPEALRRWREIGYDHDYFASLRMSVRHRYVLPRVVMPTSGGNK